MILFGVVSAPVGAGELPAERKEYLAAQSRKTQQVREINDNLLKQLKPLTGPEEDTFSQVMRFGTRASDAKFEILKAGLKAEFYRATDPKLKTDQQALRSLRNHLQNRVLGSAGIGIPSQGAKEEFRRLVCTEALVILKDLLKNNLDARALAVVLLPELQPVDPTDLDDPRRQILDGSAFTLASILTDEDQPDTIKLIAAYSAGTYLDRVNPGGNVEMRLTEALTSELESWMPADGYQLQLLETLAKVQTPREVAGVQRRAIAFDALASVMQDKRRSYLIRCRAAGALGTVGYDAQIRFEPLAWKVVQVAAEIGSAHNDEPEYPHWRKCGEQLFLSFHQRQGPGENSTEGMLNRASQSQLVQDAYGKVLPLAAGLILNQNINPELITEATEWAGANVPESLAYDGNSPPLNP